MSITIRAANENDYSNFVRLCAEVDQLHIENLPRIFQHPIDEPAQSPEYFQKLLNNPNGFIWFAEENGQVIGQICADIQKSPNAPVFKTATNLFVSNFVVLKSHRGKGIGKMLHDTALNKGKEMGADEINLIVYAFNQSALDFYRKRGFIIDSHWMSLPIK